MKRDNNGKGTMMIRVTAVIMVLIMALFGGTVAFAAMLPGMEQAPAQASADIPLGPGILFGLGVLGLTINQQVLTDIFKGLQVIYTNAAEAATPRWPKLAMKIISNSQVQAYKWIAEMARMREWLGERALTNLKAHEFTIRNKDWELTVPVARNDILFDNLGIYKPMTQMIGKSAMEHPDDLLYSVLIAGGSSLCYDGQNFFDTDHPRMDGLAVQSNKGTRAFTPSAYGAARAAMKGITDERGVNMKINPNLLVVSPTHEDEANNLLTSQYLWNISADNVRVMSDNPYRNTAELLVLNELSAYPDYWFLFDTTQPVKPLIFQEAKEPDFQAFFSMQDEHVFKNKEYLFGCDSIDNMGYALWQLAYFSDGTVNGG